MNFWLLMTYKVFHMYIYIYIYIVSDSKMVL